MKVIVCVPVLDMWGKPKRGAERVSQTKIGETLEVKRETGPYLLVKSQDQYEGWVRRSCTVRSDGRGYATKGSVVVVTSDFEPVSADETELQPVQVAPMGSVIQLVGRPSGRLKVVLPDGRVGFMRRGTVRPSRHPFARERAESIVNRALGLVGAPYLWGGTTPWGFDCSGLVQLVFGMGGYPMLRDASMQLEKNGRVVTKSEMRRGDLLFFGSTKDRKASHVAICVDRKTVVHASGSEGAVISEPISGLKMPLMEVKRVAIL